MSANECVFALSLIVAVLTIGTTMALLALDKRTTEMRDHASELRVHIYELERRVTDIEIVTWDDDEGDLDEEAGEDALGGNDEISFRGSY